MMHSAAQMLGKHIANQKHRRHFQEKKTASWRATHILIFRKGNQSMKLKFCVLWISEQMESGKVSQTKAGLIEILQLQENRRNCGRNWIIHQKEEDNRKMA